MPISPFSRLSKLSLRPKPNSFWFYLQHQQDGKKNMKGKPNREVLICAFRTARSGSKALLAKTTRVDALKMPMAEDWSITRAREHRVKQQNLSKILVMTVLHEKKTFSKD